MIIKLFFICTSLILTYASTQSMVLGIDMDVRCTFYQGSDDVNGDNVDVRIFVMGLKGNSDYTAEVIPDHNPSTTITAKTDYEGIFWVVAKVPNGENSLLFKVNVYEGNGSEGHLVASGDDDAPCYRIKPFKN